MELSNEFTVDVPVDEAWRVLTDLERIAPCMPGAVLEEVEGDDYRGVVKVKVGPVTAQYRGKASFLERDGSAHKAVLRAEGRETRGQGNANATITATLSPAGSGTRVSVVTDLAITGRIAQMGRGVLADVTDKLLGQFVDSLEATVLADAGSTSPVPDASGSEDREEGAASVRASEEGTSEGGASTEGGASAEGGAPSEEAPSRKAEDVAPVDLLELAGPSVAVRIGIPLAVLVLVLALWRRRRRDRG